MRQPDVEQQGRDRTWIAMVLGYGEFLIDTAVAFALIAGGTILLGVVVYDFVRDLGEAAFIGQVLELLSGLLLEIGVLAGTVLVLGVTVFVLRVVRRGGMGRPSARRRDPPERCCWIGREIGILCIRPGFRQAFVPWARPWFVPGPLRCSPGSNE